ncbi:MAG: DNA gyrase/topoisomerase IV subunit A [Prevotellaceae bacterium]|jgi:topoisomerase-4 subunit A|nr:DNA gyrase/topoisomerase IV subunit A [Prevotellaceae bacterium]
MAEQFDGENYTENRDEDAPVSEASFAGDEIISEESEKTGKYDSLIKDVQIHSLSGMFKEWFLDYSSYVILERAVPHIEDGLKPVQRRILYAMQRLDDGRFNKVANIIGFTMQFHPHGDASIGDALVQLGQKELLIETQGNFGNILTGDGAAAPRYIEARLSKFAIEVAFNSKTTEWMDSYDGRNKEPITLPMKFPLLLTQGVEGIAVGLASKILPHNFNELIDASIAYLKGEDFEIFPDFPTGGLADCNYYNRGRRGGRVKVRARISKIDSKTLSITEIPFGLNTSGLIDSIVKASEKSKIKIKKIDDNTARNVEILIYLPPETSADVTIDALYAFTDCEVSIPVYACVIRNNKPEFITVKDILKTNTEQTRYLLGRELEIAIAELEEDWHYSSLEKIFFEERIYRELEKDSVSWEAQLAAIDAAFAPFRQLLKREITADDILKLTEKPVRRISKFDIKKADEHIKDVENKIEEAQQSLSNLTAYTIDYYKRIKKKYGKGRERKTELRNFDIISVTQVVVANRKLYANKKEGFVGYDIKRDENAEYICDCSDIDEIIVFFRTGKYIMTKVSEKAFLDKDIIYINVFRRNDLRTIYNMIFRDGKNGAIFIKRFNVTGLMRDKEYDATKGTTGSQILHFSGNPNGEAERLKVFLKPRPRMKKLIEEVDFSLQPVRGRNSIGVILSKYSIHKIVLKEKGESTLGGHQIWLDHDTNKLNSENKGLYLGEFVGDDKILVLTKQGFYYTTSYDLVNRYEDDILLIEKLNQNKVFTLVYFDTEQNQYYIKRIVFDRSMDRERFIDENCTIVELSDDKYPQIEIKFKGKHSLLPDEYIDVEKLIAPKSPRGKGRRLTNREADSVKFIEPLEREVEDSEENILPSSSYTDTDSQDKPDSSSVQLTIDDM